MLASKDEESDPTSQKRDMGHPALAWAMCLGVTLLVAAVPFLRAFYRVQIDYNEGWNIYNAVTAGAHGWLYPARYGWTSVNYPMLSFVVMAGLHRLTHEYLFTARVVSLLSLLASGAMVGAIVFRLGGGDAKKARRAAVLAGMFTVAVFCANADYYVGMDDPQIFAQVFFLAGFYVYVSRRRSLVGIAFAALLFVVGGFIKHNPVDFPLAVLLDLVLVSRWRAAWFSAWGLALLAVGLALNTHFGGPHFMDQLLAPRSYSVMKAGLQLRNGLGPILLPLCVAMYVAARVWRDRERRVAALLLVTSLVVGGYFGGGEGVAVNSLFSAMLAIAISVGLLFVDVYGTGREEEPATWRSRTMGGFAAPIVFVWLLIPLAISGNWNVPGVMRETRAAEGRFDRQVAAMAARPGPALCESLLRCYLAGEPYLYDPFNATRLVKLGRLDQDAMVRAIADRRFGAIQLDVALGDEAKIDAVDPALRDRFTPGMLAAIRRNYVLASEDADAAIYVPAPDIGDSPWETVTPRQTR